MKTFVVLVLTVTALFLWQRNSGHAPAGQPRAALKTEAKISAPAWPKASIDRARQVAAQVRTLREENQQP